ncbi:hypothetical protein F1737_05910 [Methanoplanus sp. FWC-SCC4]|uniref:Uncharacterized protein n=1 Tax=Methanochimaera problematica TaxID=2609417 RepID=A0AA97FDL1_9EURY|nr:hypothetical protein [Methanoplanus sp. FWC-SCC4]WOF16279.1 hypothetical protein F1737_05910 [Methanoplanus sp. FWC-SCC4]
MKKFSFKKIGILLAMMLVAGAALVGPVSANQEILQGLNTIEHSIEINSSMPQMTQSEFRMYVQEMNEKYGSKNIEMLESITGEPDRTSGISYVGAWTDHLSTGSASSDNALLLYKFNEVDLSGKEHYYYWQWTSAQPNPWFDLTNFWNKVQLTNLNARLITYSPGSTITGNEQTVNIGLSTGYSGTSFSIGGDFVLHQDVVRPKSGDCQVGYGGKYAVEWNGFYGNPQEVHGAMHIDIPAGQSLTSTWTNSLTAL